METPQGEDRILTVPNLLSVVRLLCIPVFLWLLFARDDRLAAAVLLAVLGATDWVDGYVARHFDQVSTVGKVLDPTADRLLLGVGIVSIMVDGTVPVWLGFAVLARELLVSSAVVLLAGLGAKRIDVVWVGKAGTFALMVAFPLFLASGSDVGWADEGRTIAWVCAIPGLALSWFAAATYLPRAYQALLEGRAARKVAEVVAEEQDQSAVTARELRSEP